MSGIFSSKKSKQASESAEEYVAQLQDLLEHECLGPRKKESCHQLGEFYQVVQRNIVKAQEIFESNCEELNFHQSCFSLANLHLANKEQRRPEEALRLFNKACENDIFGACNNAGLLYQKGAKHLHIPKDTEKAIANYTKACTGNFKTACFNLSIIYLTGDGVAQDMKKALDYSVQSCKLGHSWGCVNASRIYTQGDGVLVNKEMAEQFKKLAKECA